MEGPSLKRRRHDVQKQRPKVPLPDWVDDIPDMMGYNEGDDADFQPERLESESENQSDGCSERNTMDAGSKPLGMFRISSQKRVHFSNPDALGDVNGRGALGPDVSQTVVGVDADGKERAAKVPPREWVHDVPSIDGYEEEQDHNWSPAGSEDDDESDKTVCLLPLYAFIIIIKVMSTKCDREWVLVLLSL